MENLTDKIIREAENELEQNLVWNMLTTSTTISIDSAKTILKSKIRQAVEEVKERLVLKEKEIDEGYQNISKGILYGYNQAVKDLEDLKKTILK